MSCKSSNILASSSFKKQIVLLLLWLFACSTFASHMMGGEVTWKCLTNGQYVFTVKVYRDCTGVLASTTNNQLKVFGYSGLSSIPLSLVGSPQDVSSSCYNPALGLQCDLNSSANFQGSVSEYTFQSNPISLSGVPPSTGWHFVYITYARNGAISNFLSANGAPISNSGFAIRSSMYRFIPPGGNTPQNAGQCYDSSPEFLEIPAKVNCVGKPFLSNNMAIDGDKDSLYYSYAAPLGQPGGGGNTWPIPPLVPMSGYSATSPFPGPAQNPQNQNAVLDVKTGVISLENHTQGNFLACIAVESWRCGQLISTVYRDIQLTNLSSCNYNNNSPIVNVVSAGLSWQGNDVWTDTVVAGSLVQFTIQAADFDLHDTANTGTFQYVSFEAFGNQFGSNFNNSQVGCNEPPCATLSPSPLTAQAYGNTVNFAWQTDCIHAVSASSCLSAASNTYNFVFKVLDDACPVPAERLIIVRITVVLDPTGPVLLTSGITSLCTGQQVGISVPNPSLTASYQWYHNNIALIGEVLPNINVSETGTYFVLINDGGYCRKSVAVSVVNNGIPNVQINNPPEFVCESGGINMYANAPGASGLQWVLNGVPIPGANQNVLTINQGGQYQLISFSGNGCSDTSGISTIVGVPGIYIDSISGPRVVNPNQVYTYSVPYFPGKNYLWSLGNGFLVSGQTTHSIEVYWFGNQLGSLFLTVSDGPCTEYKSIFIQGYISIDENDVKVSTIFPNPSSGVFKVLCDDVPSAATIRDALGRELINQIPITEEFSFDISDFADGVYFLHLQCGERSIVQRLFKSH